MGDHGETKTRAGRPALPPEERGEARHVTMPPRLVAAAEDWGRAHGVRRRSPAIVALAAQGLAVVKGKMGKAWGRSLPYLSSVPEDGERRQNVSLIIAPIVGCDIDLVALQKGMSFSGAVSALVALALDETAGGG